MKHMVQNRNIRYEIILELINNRDIHLRELSKMINFPHPTVYRKIKRLRGENILDYKIKGRNKVILLKNNIETLYMVYQSEYYKISRFIKTNPEFSILIEQLVKKAKSNLIVIFGSYAKCIAKKNSDIDLFVETKNKKMKEELENINSRLSIKIGMFDNETPLGKEIINNHLIIKGVELFYEKNPIFD